MKIDWVQLLLLGLIVAITSLLIAQCDHLSAPNAAVRKVK